MVSFTACFCYYTPLGSYLRYFFEVDQGLHRSTEKHILIKTNPTLTN